MTTTDKPFQSGMCLRIQNRCIPQPACKVGDMTLVFQERGGSLFGIRPKAWQCEDLNRAIRLLFQCFSTSNTKRCGGVGCQPCRLDQLATFKAVAVVFVLDPFKRKIDVQQLLPPAATGFQ